MADELSVSAASSTPVTDSLPPIIQGGMGIGISDWKLARAVSWRGQLGVVSGTAQDTVLVRRLQDGDIGGHMRRAMRAFPIPGVAAVTLRRYFQAFGRLPNAPYRMLPIYRQRMTAAREQVIMLATFAEVFLAKEGHPGRVGINLLTKVQTPNLPALYGAMLAGVDVVLMGAGIPREIPAVLDLLANHQPVSLRFEVEGVPAGQEELLRFTPGAHWAGPPPPLRRPQFLAIIASNSLATMLARKATGRIDGFVIEGPTAGGHNAPPRGAPRFNELGEPLYGERDMVDLDAIASLGLPFWVAGGAGRPGRLGEVRAAGAAGIQVGTLFAYCDESGMAQSLKQSVLAAVARGEVRVVTDPKASPTGYPFKVVQWPEDPSVGVQRERVCDLGGLRVAYWTPAGRVGYRCPAEPVDAYVEKGGALEETAGRQCLCNALLSDLALGQVRGPGLVEPPLVTSGDDLPAIAAFLAGRVSYTADEVLNYLLSPTDGAEPAAQ